MSIMFYFCYQTDLNGRSLRGTQALWIGVSGCALLVFLVVKLILNAVTGWMDALTGLARSFR